MGHEFSGEIEEVGAGIHDDKLKPGRRVAVRPTIYDEECSSCKQGVRHCCENIGFIGLSGIPPFPFPPPTFSKQNEAQHAGKL